MKTRLALLLIALPLISFTQQYFAPIGAEWHYSYREGASTPATGYYKLEAAKDTIIDSKNCSILAKHLVNSTGEKSFEGLEYIYSDTTNNQVYRYLFGQFYLLYDFNKEGGDTLIIREPHSTSEYTSITLIVDSISYDTFSDGLRLKSQHVSQTMRENEWFFSGKNTEKIGNNYYFFPTNELDCDGGCPQPLRCYSDNEIEFHLYNTVPCDTIYTHSEMTDKPTVKIYPVPFESFLTIEAGADYVDNYSIELFNNTGTFVLRQTTVSGKTVLDMSRFHPGSYFIRLRTGTDIFIKKITKL